MANERCLIAGYCTSQNLGRDGSRSRSVAAEAVGAPCRLLLVSSAISPILFIDPQALSLTLFPYQTPRTSVLARGPGVPHPLSIARSPLITHILLLPLSSLISRCSFLFTLCRVFCSAFPRSLPFLSADQRTFLLSIVYTHSSHILGLDSSDFLWISLLSDLSLHSLD